MEVRSEWTKGALFEPSSTETEAEAEANAEAEAVAETGSEYT